MTDRCLTTLAVLSKQVLAALGGLAPTEIAAFEVLRPHALAAFAHHRDPFTVNGDLHLHWLSRSARIQSVVDQLHQRVRRRPVVGKKRGRDLGMDPFPNRYPPRGTSHSRSIEEGDPAVKGQAPTQEEYLAANLFLHQHQRSDVYSNHETAPDHDRRGRRRGTREGRARGPYVEGRFDPALRSRAP